MISSTVPVVWELPREDLKVYPVFDLHIGAAGCMTDEWERFAREIAKDEHARIVLGGDMMNNGIKSSKTNVYEETMRPRAQKEKLYEDLLPIKDKILFATSGNHEYRSNREVDSNPLYDVLCRLQIEDKYREDGGVLKLRFGPKGCDGLRNPTYSAYIGHGAGGGMTIGAGANRAERYNTSMEGVDMQFTGHTHKQVSFPVDKTVFDSRNENLVHRTVWIVIASSWLRPEGYAQRAMYPATAHVITYVSLCGTSKRMSVTSGDDK